jgi:hypothetical protein
MNVLVYFFVHLFCAAATASFTCSKNKCFKKTVQGYAYEMCFFKNSKQDHVRYSPHPIRAPLTLPPFGSLAIVVQKKQPLPQPRPRIADVAR